MVESELLRQFARQARLFPLPDHVLFPAVVQPLHLFESRYVEMLEDALQGDQLIAMALLKPGWQGEYYGRPPIEEVVCVGRVLNHERVGSDRYNILLRGVSRARLVQELPAKFSYRQAELTLIAEEPTSASATATETLKQRLVAGATDAFRGQNEVITALEEIAKLNVGLGHLSDLLAHLLPFDASIKQRLLEEPRAVPRAEILLVQMEQLTTQPPTRKEWHFPPNFGDN